MELIGFAPFQTCGFNFGMLDGCIIRALSFDSGQDTRHRGHDRLSFISQAMMTLPYLNGFLT
jgi:hypothetical protein